MEYIFQFPLSRGCTLWQYIWEQAFLNTFFNYPYQEGVLYGIIWGTGILEYLFQLPLSRVCILWHYMGTGTLESLFKFLLSSGCTLWHSYEEQSFGIPFSIPPINRVYSGIHMRNKHLGCLFQFPLSRGCTPALYEEQAFGIRFSIPPIKGLYSLAIYLGTGIFEYLFQFPLSSRCTLALNEEQAFWNAFFNYP